MKKFNCKCYDGTINEFIWNVTEGEYLIPDQSSLPVVEYTIRSTISTLGGTFTIQVLEYDTEIKILHQSRDFMPSVTGKGITAGMLIELFSIYNGKAIISSSRKPTDILGESRSADMEKVYKGLAAAEIVRYNNIRDVFIYTKEDHEHNLKTLIQS